MLGCAAGGVGYVVMHVWIGVQPRPAVIRPVDLFDGFPTRAELSGLVIAASATCAPANLGVWICGGWGGLATWTVRQWRRGAIGLSGNVPRTSTRAATSTATTTGRGWDGRRGRRPLSSGTMRASCEIVCA